MKPPRKTSPPTTSSQGAAQTAEAWRELQYAFLELLELEPGERPAALDAHGPALRAELAAMLRAHGQALDVESQLLPAERRDDKLVGRRLGAYTLVREIGSGGMGTVYLAERRDGYEQRAALKIMRWGLGGQETTERFRRERQILARLEHPNIARLLDGGVSDDGRPYLVMQLIDGEPITRFCDARRLDVDARLELFRAVCGAVDYAHRNLVVHRDLKPSNILAREHDGRPEVSLLDFGIAKLLEDDPAAGVTSSELRLMTPEHAAPEQVRGEAVTTATDTYALGLLLYELLAGARPFQQEKPSRSQLETWICARVPDLPSQAAREAGDEVARDRSTTRSVLDRRLRGDLDTIVARALAKEPERRYGSARQLAEDVERHLEGLPVLARPDSLGYRLGRFVTRHAWQVGAVGVIAALLLAFTVTTVLQSRALERERDEAHLERQTAEQVTGVLVELFELADPHKAPGGKRLTVDELLELHSATVIDRLGEQPAVQSRVRHVLGRVHRAHSRFERSRELIEQALAQQRQLADPDALEVLALEHDLALLAKDMGERRRAERLLRRSLEGLRELHGEEHEDVAQAMQDLAPLLPVSSAERAQLLEGSLAIRRRLEPEPGMMVASSLNDLALLDLWNGRHEKAVNRLREVSQLVEELAGPEHPHTLATLGNLGAALSRSGHFAQAVEIERDILARKRATLGTDTIEVVRSLNNLGSSLANLGRLEEAERYLVEGREVALRLVGEHHQDSVNPTRNLARVVELRERPREALDLLEQATGAELDKATPFEQPFFANQMAALAMRLGRPDEASAELTRILEELEEAFPQGDYRIGETLGLRAEARALAGDFEGAAGDYRRMLGWYRSQAQETPFIAFGDCGLAQVLSELGDVAEARRLFDSCLGPLDRWGLVHPDTRRAITRAAERVLGAAEPSAPERAEFDPLSTQD